LTFGVVWAYVTITGDEYGEKLQQLTEKVSLYPFTAPAFDPSKYPILNKNSTDNTNATGFNPSSAIRTS
jgi:hypothetical protein